ncbi:hypothetical protein BJV78DRAFT_1256986 [Lactifluus subvellereus]|nr:hypothetical protein BJV78DRAFT_1256986 [Lactifluus subvellereus]
MVRSAETVRDAILSAQPQEDIREHALVEYEERVAAIQALAQGVLSLRLHIKTPERESAHHTPDWHTPSNVAEKEKHEIGSKITSESAGSSGKDGVFPGLEMVIVSPQSNHDAPSALPLHLVPLLPQRNTPPKRRQPSINPFVDRNDEDPAEPHWHRSPPHSTGETPPTVQSEFWEFQTRTAESSGISRTLAYAMSHMESMGPVRSLPLHDGKLDHLVTPKETEVDHNEEIGTKQEAVDLGERTSKSPGGADSLGTDGIQVDAIAMPRDTTARETNGEVKRGDARAEIRSLEAQREELRQKGGVRKEEELQREAPALQKPRRVTFAEVGARRTGEGVKETKAEAWCIAVNQDHEEPKARQRDVFKDSELATRETEGPILTLQNLELAQPWTERSYTGLKEREVEIRKARTEIQTLEETFQARERDLRNRLETVRLGLEAIRQRKAFIDRQEDDLRQKLVDASREQELEEVPEPAERELQVVGAEMEADALSEESSRYTVKSVSSYKERINQSSVLKDRIRTRNET